MVSALANGEFECPSCQPPLRVPADGAAHPVAGNRAPLDGTVVPYVDDVRFTGVSVRQLDERTIEESNLGGDTVVQVTRRTVGPDGRRIHVRFDDAHDHVMEQTGHRLPER